MTLIGCTTREGITACGKGKLRVKDLEDCDDMIEDLLEEPEGFVFEIESGCTEVECGVFDGLTNLYEIDIPPTVKKITLSEESLALFRKNGMLICGVFDSYAEQFAKEYHLRFLHSDIEIARVGDVSNRVGTDIITLCLTAKGMPFLKMQNFTQGSSAGNMGGGDNFADIPRNFYQVWTQEQLASHCWGTCHDAIMKCEELSTFLEKAKERKGFYFKF